MIRKGHQKVVNRVSIRTGTFLLEVVWRSGKFSVSSNLWVGNVSLEAMYKQLSINNTTTVVNWASFCRKVVYGAMIKKMEKLGKPGKIVEIDESEFGQRKYYRGCKVDIKFGSLENLKEAAERYSWLRL